jgi:hypothetical protein
VLGLKSRFRGEELVANLIDQNLEVNVTWGIEVDEFEPEYLDSLIDQRKARYILGRRLSYGELSCALGHFEMYEKFLLTNKEWGLFFEDDAVVRNRFDATLDYLPSGLSPTILSLTSAQDERFEPRPFPFLKSELNFGEGYRFRKCAISPVLAHAYLMNRSGAIAATHSLRSQRIYSPADFPFQFRNDFSFFASEVGYVTAGNLASILDADRQTEISAENRRKWNEKYKRRFRVICDYSGIGVVFAKVLGLSARDYFNERVKLRSEYKKFLRGNSEKFFR